MEGRDWEIPYLARRYQTADDRRLYEGYDYYNDEIIGPPQKGDFAVSPDRSKENPDSVDDEPDYSIIWGPYFVGATSYANQLLQDVGIIYERQNKGIPMLHICDVKLQYGSEDHAKYIWKLDEVTKECELEIDHSDKNEQGKKTVKFSFATSDTDKLLSQVIDGYEVKYMLRTNAMRLQVELDVVCSTPEFKPDFNNVRGAVKLEFEHDGKPYTFDLLNDLHPSKKQKLDCSDTFNFSCIRIIPRNLCPESDIKLNVAFKDSTHTLDADELHKVFPYNLPVDQCDYIHFKNGYIRLYVFWGCRLRVGKGVCTEVCTCEPGKFIGFPNPGEVSCSRTNEE